MQDLFAVAALLADYRHPRAAQLTPLDDGQLRMLAEADCRVAQVLDRLCDSCRGDDPDIDFEGDPDIAVA